MVFIALFSFLAGAPALAGPADPVRVWSKQSFICEQVRAEMETENLSNIAPVNKEEIVEAYENLRQDLVGLQSKPCAGPEAPLAKQLFEFAEKREALIADGMIASSADTCTSETETPRRAREIEAAIRATRELRAELGRGLLQLNAVVPPVGPLPAKDGILDLYEYASTRAWPGACEDAWLRSNYKVVLLSGNELGCKLDILETRMRAVAKRLASGAPNEVQDGLCRETRNADGSIKALRGLREFKDGFGLSDVTGTDGL